MQRVYMIKNDRADIRYSDVLYHHGVKGQKWGIRRYQNEDGSYKNGADGRYAKPGLRQRYKSWVKKNPRKAAAVSIGAGLATAVAGYYGAKAIGSLINNKRQLANGSRAAVKYANVKVTDLAPTLESKANTIKAPTARDKFDRTVRESRERALRDQKIMESYYNRNDMAGTVTQGNKRYTAKDLADQDTFDKIMRSKKKLVF